MPSAYDENAHLAVAGNSSGKRYTTIGAGRDEFHVPNPDYVPLLTDGDLNRGRVVPLGETWESKQGRADILLGAANDEDSRLRALLEERITGIQNSSAADAATALAQFNQDNATRLETGQRTLDNDIHAPIQIGSLAPLQDITGVAVNDAFAGANQATSPYYVNPESVVSQFNITESLGGGLGPRQRKSTDDLTSLPGDITGGKKDQF